MILFDFIECFRTTFLRAHEFNEKGGYNLNPMQMGAKNGLFNVFPGPLFYSYFRNRYSCIYFDCILIYTLFYFFYYDRTPLFYEVMEKGHIQNTDTLIL